MKIERLIEKGLLLGGSGKADMDGIASRDRESMHMHGQVLRSSAESSTEDELDGHHEHDEHDEHEHERETRGWLLGKEDQQRRSVIQEFKRQSGVFFDDYGEGEDTGVSDEDLAVAPPMELVDGHDKQE